MTTESWEEQFNAAVRLRDDAALDDAIAILESLLESAPRPGARAAVLGVLGGIYLDDVKDYEKAEVYFRQCIAASPRSELASISLFHTLAKLGRLFEAFDEARRLVSLRPSAEYDLLLKEIHNSIVEHESSTGGPRDPRRRGPDEG